MRMIVALLITFSVLIDFSASCLAEDFSICHSEDISVSIDHDLSKTTDSSPSHTHPKGSDSHHCHGGHIHAAVNFPSGFVSARTSLNFTLEFFDYSLSIPSPFLSEIIRPPILT